MNPEEAMQALFHTLDTKTHNSLNRSMSYLKTGQLETRPNPFRPGETMTIAVPAYIRALHEQLKRLGVNTDSDLLAALRQALSGEAFGALIGLFVAHDGEGAIYSSAGTEVQLELRIRGGEPLPGYLHEVFDKAWSK